MLVELKYCVQVNSVRFEGIAYTVEIHLRARRDYHSLTMSHSLCDIDKRGMTVLSVFDCILCGQDRFFIRASANQLSQSPDKKRF